VSFSVRKKSELVYFTCDALEKAGFLNAFSTRLGGVSPMPQHALNLGPKQDTPENYAENLRRFLDAIDATGWPLETANQTHSDIRLHVDHIPHREGDALITRQSKVLVGVKTADCLPVLIADPKTGAMAAVHAGWRGTLARIAEKTVADLTKNPGDCIAALGPGACGQCYEVGPDVAQAFPADFLKPISDKKSMLDVTAANRAQLEAAGLKPANIHAAPACTMHQNELFFSHRIEAHLASAGGRSLSVIGRVH
jgi:polyphenol oxidase